MSRQRVVPEIPGEDNDDAEFIGMVIFFWKQKSDPTRYMGWDADRCAKLMPAFYTAWEQYSRALVLMRNIADTY